MEKRFDKLKAHWGKMENDIILTYPHGVGTKSDAHWLSGVFSKEFEAELRNRGYDISTLKFSIAPDLNHKDADRKFPTLKSLT